MSSCSKVSYPTKIAAVLAIHAIQRRNAARDRKGPTGAYICSACKRWHLTSKSGTQTPPWERETSRARQRGGRQGTTPAPE